MHPTAKLEKLTQLPMKPYPAYKPSGVPWLGNVPQHWEVQQLGRIGRFSKGAGGTKEDEVPEGIPCIRYGDLYTSHEFHIRSTRSFVNDTNGTKYTQLRYGDILFAGSGETIDEIGKSAVNLIESRVCCGGDVIIFRPDIEIDATFSGYATDCPQSQVQKSGMGKGITVMHIYGNQLKYLSIPLPPLPEQRAIVRYLDHVDERIKRYVDAKEKLVGVLEEEKQAVVNHAVTRGLDPNTPLKPSGVDWLGDVPEHWEVRRLGQLATSFRTGPFGSMLHQSDYIENGIPVVNPVHMRCGEIVEDSKSTVPEAIAEKLSNYRLDSYDLVFSRRGELGRCVLVRDRETKWLCGTGSIRVRISYCGIEPEFLIQALQGKWVGEHLSIFAVGTTMANLNTGILKGVPVPLPPVYEQGDILEYIRKKGQGIDAAITRARRQIELLQEYRTRLIADVVTGKLDVREAASQLPEESADDVPMDTNRPMTDNDEAGLKRAPA